MKSNQIIIISVRNIFRKFNLLNIALTTWSIYDTLALVQLKEPEETSKMQFFNCQTIF